MKKKVLVISVIGIIVVAACAGGYAFWRVRNKKQHVAKVSVEAQQQLPVEPIVQKRAGVYEPYDVSKLTDASDGKVVLFFYANWSAPSKLLDKDLSANVSKIPPNFTIMKIDYNKSADLKKKYQVPFENTFVQVDANGTMVNRWSGSESLDEIVALAK